MCTSITMKTDNFYFGRNMDLEYKFGERVVITPRNYPFYFRQAERMEEHYAIIGMATVAEGYPLYAEGVNEKGLCIAGLNFPENAYFPTQLDPDKINISPFELIPWLLGKCDSVNEAKKLILNTKLVDIPFNSQIPVAPLHWHIADKYSSLVLESTKSGMNIYENPVGVLTNNPCFPFHLENLCQYINLTPNQPDNYFGKNAGLKPFSAGVGSIGLPGDFSSASRFVKASYLLLNSKCGSSENESISQFFHLLSSVAMVQGSVVIPDGRCEITIYSCCIDADKGIYYYTTYLNQGITAVDMKKENLNSSQLIEYPLQRLPQIFAVN